MQKSDVNSQTSASSPAAPRNGHSPYCAKSPQKVERPRWAFPIKSPIEAGTKAKALVAHHAPLIRSGLTGLIDASGLLSARRLTTHQWRGNCLSNINRS